MGKGEGKSKGRQERRESLTQPAVRGNGRAIQTRKVRAAVVAKSQSAEKPAVTVWIKWLE